jgi:hypothetical protein
MNIYPNPIDFNILTKIDDLEIVYSELLEIVQGGPLTGIISINGNQILSYRFGGPFLVDSSYVYIPVYVSRFLGWGFKICKINTKSFVIEPLGSVMDLIFLDKIIDNKIFFFTDLNKSILKFYQM